MRKATLRREVFGLMMMLACLKIALSDYRGDTVMKDNEGNAA